MQRRPMSSKSALCDSMEFRTLGDRTRDRQHRQAGVHQPLAWNAISCLVVCLLALGAAGEDEWHPFEFAFRYDDRQQVTAASGFGTWVARDADDNVLAAEDLDWAAVAALEFTNKDADGLAWADTLVGTSFAGSAIAMARDVEGRPRVAFNVADDTVVTVDDSSGVKVWRLDGLSRNTDLDREIAAVDPPVMGEYEVYLLLPPSPNRQRDEQIRERLSNRDRESGPESQPGEVGGEWRPTFAFAIQYDDRQQVTAASGFGTWVARDADDNVLGAEVLDWDAVAALEFTNKDSARFGVDTKAWADFLGGSTMKEGAPIAMARRERRVAGEDSTRPRVAFRMAADTAVSVDESSGVKVWRVSGLLRDPDGDVDAHRVAPPLSEYSVYLLLPPLQELSNAM